MGDTDQRPKQVEGFEIPADVAAYDRALHQRIDGSLDQPARTLIELRGAPDDTIQCGGNDLLCRDVVDEQQHPGSQCFNRGHCFSELACRRSQLFHFTPINRFDQGIAGGKVTIQSSGSHSRLSGNIVQAGVSAKSSKRLLRHLQNALAVSLRIRARLSLGGL